MFLKILREIDYKKYLFELSYLIAKNYLEENI